jgi:phosphonoacetaldehyde hydrolase
MANDAAVRPYRGPIRAALLDWAGTTVDYGSCAPAGVFVEVFARNGIEITVAQARGPMGAHKRDHIAALLALPEVLSQWHSEKGRAPTANDAEAMYQQAIPLQVEALPRYCELIPGTLEAIAEFRRRGMRIGSSTGYNREMMDVVQAEARKSGFEPDCVMTVDDVPAGRPHPWMALRNMIELETYPAEAWIKVGDTLPDIFEGLNAGMWTIALTRTGNELGLGEAEAHALPADEMEARLNAAGVRFLSAGAHYVTQSIGDVPTLLDEIETRLSHGERP